MGLWQGIKAWRRSEKRVAPKGQTGRVYAKKGEEAGGPTQVPAGASGTLTMKITRADGRIENVKVPAQLEQVE